MTYFTGQKILQKLCLNGRRLSSRDQWTVIGYMEGVEKENDNFSIFTLFLNPMNYKCAVSEGYYHTVTSESALTLAKFFIFRDHDISCGFAAHTTFTHITHMVWSLTHFFVFFHPKTLTFWHLKLRVHTISYHGPGSLTRVDKKHNNVVRLEWANVCLNTRSDVIRTPTKTSHVHQLRRQSFSKRLPRQLCAQAIAIKA